MFCISFALRDNEGDWVFIFCLPYSNSATTYIAAVQVVSFLGVGGVIDKVSDGLGSLSPADRKQECDGASSVLQFFHYCVCSLLFYFRKIDGSSDGKRRDPT